MEMLNDDCRWAFFGWRGKFHKFFGMILWFLSSIRGMVKWGKASA